MCVTTRLLAGEFLDSSAQIGAVITASRNVITFSGPPVADLTTSFIDLKSRWIYDEFDGFEEVEQRVTGAHLKPFVYGWRREQQGESKLSAESRLAIRQPGISTNAVSRARVYEVAKSVVDFGMALLLLLLLLPVFVLIAVAIKLESRGPVFFIQERVGRDGRLFGFVKFRSMENGAHQRHEEVIGEFQEGAAVGVKADPRVTSVGAVLRRWSIDELPQLINVLRGQMSIIGPRPIMVSEMEQLDPHHHDRHIAKPGITGLWQVSGRKDTTWEERMALDLEYVRSRGAGMDARILARTAKVVVSGDGAY